MSRAVGQQRGKARGLFEDVGDADLQNQIDRGA